MLLAGRLVAQQEVTVTGEPVISTQIVWTPFRAPLTKGWIIFRARC
jgi:hypothetical protein